MWAFKGVDVAIVAAAHPLLLPLLMIKVIGKVTAIIKMRSEHL